MKLLQKYLVNSEEVFIVEAEYKNGGHDMLETSSEPMISFIKRKFEQLGEVKQFNVYKGKRYTAIIAGEEYDGCF